MENKGKIACLLAADFEDSEFHVPHEHLIAQGYAVEVISPEAGVKLQGKKNKVTAVADFSIDDVDVDDYVGLLIPGGASPDHLRSDNRFVEFVQEFEATKRPIAAICHGPQLLISAGLCKGRTLTAYKSVQADLQQLGAVAKDEAVVRDGNWITSRTPEDLGPFVETFIEALGEEALSDTSGSSLDAEARIH